MTVSLKMLPAWNITLFFSSSQRNHEFYEIQINCCVWKNPTLVTILRKMKQVHTLPSYLFMTRYNILTYAPRTSKNSLSFHGFPSQYSMHFFFLTCMLMRRTPHPPLPGHPNSHEQDSGVCITVYHIVSLVSRGAVKRLAIKIWNYHFQAVSCLY